MEQNDIERGSLELILGRPYPPSAPVGSTVQFLSDLKDLENGCSIDLNSTTCVYQGDGTREMLSALRGGTGVELGTDYDGCAVYAAYTFSSEVCRFFSAGGKH